MNCPRCEKRWTTPDAGPYRGAPGVSQPIALAPETHRAGVSFMRCPACRGAFVAYEAMQTIDAFGRDARRKVSTAEMARRAAGRGDTAIACPSCASETTRREWSFSTLVFVDVCIECRGVWLDGGELEALDGTGP